LPEGELDGGRFIGANVGQSVTRKPQVEEIYIVEDQHAFIPITPPRQSKLAKV
jgi:hypothetical protein